MVNGWVKWAVAASAAAVMSAASALADARSEAFVAQYATQAITILNDETMPLADKKVQFRTIVNQVTDADRIARFVLGAYRSLQRNPHYNDEATLTADIDEFAEIFKEYAIGIYESQLGEYRGEDLLVLGSTDRAVRANSPLTSDVIVHTEVTGGSQDEPLPVNWRVQNRDGDIRVVDVEVFGVWLAINQREEMTAIIGDANGDITAATVALRAEIAKREAEDAEAEAASL